MKDWKTYAIVILAVWCAYLTWRIAATCEPRHVRSKVAAPTVVPHNPGRLLRSTK